ncbi:sporulation protein, partial [Pseudomonas sp. HMWF031]
MSPFVSNLRPVLRAVALAPLAVAALAGEPRVAVTAQEPMMRVLIAEAQTLQFRADAALPLRVRGLGG